MNGSSTNYPARTGEWGCDVELVEYGDFTCARCRQCQVLLTKVFAAFGGQIQYTFRHFPNNRNETAMLAAVAVEAARRQGYFWPMHQALFTQRTITRTTLSILAVYQGLNDMQFLNDLDDSTLWNHIEADRCEGHRLGVTTTPTLFINGQRFHGKLTESRLTPILYAQLHRPDQPILSRVDTTTGLIYWGKGEYP